MKTVNLIPLNNSQLFALAAFDIIDSAQRNDEIIANYFVVRNDNAGIRFINKLRLAAQRGAKIKLIVDSYGSLHNSDNGTEYSSAPLSLGILNALERSGVDVNVYRHIESTSFLDFRNITKWNNYSRRNHNKNLLFNLKTLNRKGLIIGDSQWAQEHFTEKFKGNNVLIEGNRIYRQCLNYHNKLSRTNHLSKPHLKSTVTPFHSDLDANKAIYYLSAWYRPLQLKDRDIQFVFNDIKFKDGLFRKTIQDHEISLMNHSRKDIFYSTPYFCPDEELQRCFVKNNKKLKIFFGKFEDDPYLPYGLEKASENLLQHNVKMFTYPGKGNIHYKDLICDRMSFIKTANGDGRSRFFNLETGVIINNRHYSQFAMKNILKDFNLAKALKEKVRNYKDSLPKRMIKKVLTPFYYHHL